MVSGWIDAVGAIVVIGKKEEVSTEAVVGATVVVGMIVELGAIVVVREAAIVDVAIY